VAHQGRRRRSGVGTAVARGRRPGRARRALTPPAREWPCIADDGLASVRPVSPARSRPPGVADERTLLIGWLDLQRALVRWKCEGLADADARRAVLPASPLMTMAGLVSHLRWTEHLWFEVIFLGHEQDRNPQFDEDDDADWRAD